MAIGINARTAFSLFFPPILDEFGWERGITVGAFSLGFVISMVFTPLLGRAMDRWGPRWVMPVGVLMTSAGLALGALTTQPWHLYATLGVLVAAGTVVGGYTGHAQFLPHWFVRRRGLATGIAFSGVGVGSIVILPWLQAMIQSSGWRTACWAMAIVVLALVPMNFFLQRRRPEDMGLRADGDPTPAASTKPGGHPTNVVDTVWASTDWTVGRAMATARFWWVVVAFFGGLFAWYAVQAHQTKYLLEIGFSPGTAAYALGFVGLTGIVGQIALGWLSDRIGREWVWTIATLGFALCYALLLAMKQHPTPALLYLMVASQGVLGYGLASVYGAIPAELFQGRNYGSIFGWLGFASGLGAGAGPWVTGAVYDRTGSYAPAFWLTIALCLVSVVAMWLAAPRKVRVVAGRITG
ncbi:MAG: MFS transporter [Candidatus Rokubacteria bacterium]|nr:MFS transporter [Candidatus Rokubacteria bacterium]